MSGIECMTEQFMRAGGQLDEGKVGWKAADHQLRIRLLREEFDETILGEYNNDPAEVADGLCDVIVIALGTLYSYFGVDLATHMLNEVGWSNLSKFEDGEPVLREDGKILKGKDYYPPKLAAILESFKEEWDV